MFTECPSCNRQFRITAGHLSAAHGQVKCGYCGMQFNALERLHDSPLPPNRAEAVPVSIPGPDSLDPEPEFEIPDQQPAPDPADEPIHEQQRQIESSSAAGTIPAHDTEPDQAPGQQEPQLHYR